MILDRNVTRYPVWYLVLDFNVRLQKAVGAKKIGAFKRIGEKHHVSQVKNASNLGIMKIKNKILDRYFN